MSPTSHFSAAHIRTRTSVFAFPPFPSFATEVALMLLISRRVFLINSPVNKKFVYLWHGMVEFVTVYGKDDIRFTMKDRTEIRA